MAGWHPQTKSRNQKLVQSLTVLIGRWFFGFLPRFLTLLCRMVFSWIYVKSTLWIRVQAQMHCWGFHFTFSLQLFLCGMRQEFCFVWKVHLKLGARLLLDCSWVYFLTGWWCALGLYSIFTGYHNLGFFFFTAHGFLSIWAPCLSSASSDSFLDLCSSSFR